MHIAHALNILDSLLTMMAMDSSKAGSRVSSTHVSVRRTTRQQPAIDNTRRQCLQRCQQQPQQQ
jgi:hypothetical protein